MKAAILPLLLILTAAVSQSATETKQVASSKDGQLRWQRITPPDEEFSALVPVLPAFTEDDHDVSLRENGEKVLKQRYFSGYADGLIFVIESYQARRPRKLLEDVESIKSLRDASESGIMIRGFKAKQYLFNSPNAYGKKLSFVTKQHVYLVTIASRDENNADATKFLSSLIPGDKISEPATGYAFDIKESSLYKNAISGAGEVVQSQGQIFKSKDVTRKAQIIERPEPHYTEEARSKQVMGTVVLRAVFDADGQVKHVRVLSGLGHGLTENAIGAALCIRFFPAEKDGQRVSQYIQIEYNFNLY